MVTATFPVLPIVDFATPLSRGWICLPSLGHEQPLWLIKSRIQRKRHCVTFRGGWYWLLFGSLFLGTLVQGTQPSCSGEDQLAYTETTRKGMQEGRLRPPANSRIPMKALGSEKQRHTILNFLCSNSQPSVSMSIIMIVFFNATKFWSNLLQSCMEELVYLTVDC